MLPWSLSLLTIYELLEDQEVQTVCICAIRHVSIHLQHPGAVQPLTWHWLCRTRQWQDNTSMCTLFVYENQYSTANQSSDPNDDVRLVAWHDVVCKVVFFMKHLCTVPDGENKVEPEPGLLFSSVKWWGLAQADLNSYTSSSNNPLYRTPESGTF